MIEDINTTDALVDQTNPMLTTISLMKRAEVMALNKRHTKQATKVF